MKKIVYVFVSLTILLSGCGTLEISFDVTPVSAVAEPVSFPATPAPVPVLLSLDSTSEEIQAAMLESATKWDTIWMDGTVTWYDPTGSGQPPQVFHEQVWLDLPNNHFRVLLGLADGAAGTFKVCDGITILEMDLTSGQSQSRPLPGFVADGQGISSAEPDMVYPSLIWGQIGTPLSELIFSADRAQNQGTFKPIAIENVAGRGALVVDWTYIQNQQPSFRAWLDIGTAVILRIQEFGKAGGDEVQSERVVNQVVFDAPFGDNLFALQFSELPVFSDIFGKPLAAAEPVSTASTDETDALGQVYFFITDHNYGNETTELVRLPGSCVAGQATCPEPELITPPFGLNFSLMPLVWSPNGNYAAVAYPVSEDGNTATLFLFDPEKQDWQPLANFNFIDPPVWSRDGNWLAFRVQDGFGSDDIYVVRRDGSDLTNMTDTDKLPSEGRPYILSGWINDNIILRSGNPGVGGLVYLRRVGDGFTKPLFDTPWTKTDMVPSPDGSFLAYPDAVDAQTVLKLLSPDGNTFRDLAVFPSSSIYPILWSPDGMQITFARLYSEPINGQEVFVIGRDGRDMKNVYQSAFGSISSISYSPDGGYLLIQDDDATGRHIYTVDLSTLEAHLLQAPNLPLDWWWLAPSWRP